MKNKNAYVYVTRNQAKAQSEEMYKSSIYVKSELISSYAWDTALNFICQNSEYGYTLAITNNKEYGNLATGMRELTGNYTADRYSNIHDMVGNCFEWTTEIYDNALYPTVNRGGHYFERIWPICID